MLEVPGDLEICSNYPTIGIKRGNFNAILGAGDLQAWTTSQYSFHVKFPHAFFLHYSPHRTEPLQYTILVSNSPPSPIPQCPSVFMREGFVPCPSPHPPGLKNWENSGRFDTKYIKIGQVLRKLCEASLKCL